MVWYIYLFVLLLDFSLRRYTPTHTTTKSNVFNSSRRERKSSVYDYLLVFLSFECVCVFVQLNGRVTPLFIHRYENVHMHSILSNMTALCTITSSHRYRANKQIKLYSNSICAVVAIYCFSCVLLVSILLVCCVIYSS